LGTVNKPHGENIMAANVGGIDKILRIVAGAGLVGATAAGMLPVWGYIGIVPLATGLMGWCPLYPLLGMNTCPTKK
jgi:glyoxylate carboligase